MKLISFSSFIILTFIGISCTKNSAIIAATIDQQTILNISYGADAYQKMDVYLPANRSKASTKVMVMIHGGGWTGGDKADLQAFVDTVKKIFPDYAIININYRLSTGTVNLFPTQEIDVQAAMEFIFHQSDEYLISEKYVLVGASAGAHLAMLQGYKYTVPVKPKAIVSFFGPSDLTDMYNNPVGGNAILSAALAGAIGKTPAQDAALYINSSPVTYIDGNSPPTILFHGSNDPLVKPSQSEIVHTKLSAAGVASQYILYPGKGHGDDWGSAVYADAFANMKLFLEANVQ